MRCDEFARKVAEAVIKECRQSLVAAYEDAGTSGLCAERRWEMALRFAQRNQSVQDHFLVRAPPRRRGRVAFLGPPAGVGAGSQRFEPGRIRLGARSYWRNPPPVRNSRTQTHLNAQ